MWEYRAHLSRIVDGDTLMLVCDTGFGGRQEESFRLLDVSAPELSQPGGREVVAFVREWFAALPGLRWPLLVRTDVNTLPEPEERRTFVRYLATVYDIRGVGESLNTRVSSWLAIKPEWGTGL